MQPDDTSGDSAEIAALRQELASPHLHPPMTSQRPHIVSEPSNAVVAMAAHKQRPATDAATS